MGHIEDLHEDAVIQGDLVPTVDSIEEQAKIWRLTHERLLKELQTLKLSLESEKSGWNETVETLQSKLHTQDEHRQQIEKRLSTVEKQWKRMKSDGGSR